MAICICKCETCHEKTLVIDKDMVSIVKFQEEYTLATMCSHCEFPIVQNVEEQIAVNMISLGVNILSWLDEGVC